MGCFPSDRGCERRSESSIEKHSPAKYCSAEQYRLCCKAISYISGYVVLNRLYCRISTAAFSAPGTFIVGHWQLLQSIAVRMKSPASEDRFETYYSILGVSRTASTAEIDRLVDTTVHRFEENAKEAERDQPKLWAYRRLSLYVHPDKGGDPEAFRRVKRAHNVLKDPELRKLYSQFGPALLPSPGHLIGSGTIGRLVPFSMSATGGIACQFFLVMGSFGVNLWGLGCAVTAGVSWLKARATNGHTDSVAPAILGGLLLGNVAGFCLGASTRGAMRLLPWK